MRHKPRRLPSFFNRQASRPAFLKGDGVHIIRLVDRAKEIMIGRTLRVGVE
jgi:hypothetical protein